MQRDKIPQIWGIVAPMLQKAINKSQNDMNLADIYAFLDAKDMQLWVWHENDTINACCVTQIVNYPRRKLCQVPFLAGLSYKQWIHAEEMIGNWAKSQGCSQMEGFCRDGWLNVLRPKGWFKVWNTMRKDL